MGGNLLRNVSGRSQSSTEDWRRGSGGSPVQGGGNRQERTFVTGGYWSCSVPCNVQHPQDDTRQPGQDTGQRQGPLSQHCSHLHCRPTLRWIRALLKEIYIYIFSEHASHTKTEADKFVVENWCKRDLCPLARFVASDQEENQAREKSLVYELYDEEKNISSEFIR